VTDILKISSMGKEKNKLIGIALTLLVALGGAAWYGLHHTLTVLSTKGQVGDRERHLIIIATLLMLIVVIPVYFLTFFIAWKYRSSNKQARYEPDQDGNRALEITWWAIPGIIILILSVITWNSSHSLDPFRSLSSQGKPLKVQVIALPWKWLFIYPDQNVASVNFLQIPTDRDIDFSITSDAPMNSFWIPQLGGQIYAMAGMDTHLHLAANTPGDYQGVSANISGKGFAGMHFIARAGSQADFNSWVGDKRAESKPLDQPTYDQLAEPSENDPVSFYNSVEPSLYDKVLLKYTVPNSALIGGDIESFTQEAGHHHD